MRSLGGVKVHIMKDSFSYFYSTYDLVHTTHVCKCIYACIWTLQYWCHKTSIKHNFSHLHRNVECLAWQDWDIIEYSCGSLCQRPCKPSVMESDQANSWPCTTHTHTHTNVCTCTYEQSWQNMMSLCLMEHNSRICLNTLCGKKRSPSYIEAERSQC